MSDELSERSEESTAGSGESASGTHVPGAPILPGFAGIPTVELRDHTPALPGAPRSEALLLVAAIALGIACDALTIRSAPDGVGITLTLLLGLVALVPLVRVAGLGVASRGRWLLVAAMAALAMTFAYRASDDLLAMNAFALFVAMILLGVRVDDRTLPEVRLGEFAVAAAALPVLSGIRAAEAAARVGQDATTTRGHAGGHGRDIAIGIAIAIPVLAVFTALLVAADKGFAHLVGNLFDWNVGEVALHAGIVVLAAVAFAAFLISSLASVPLQRQDESRTHWAGSAVVWIVLGSTVALFAIFVTLQASYLFGGAAFLDDATDLSAAEYGRHRFFELSVVAALVVPLILVFRRWHADTDGAARAYQVAAPALAALTILLQVSAFSRMWIYQERFGLSEQRVYANVILVWIAAGLAWIGIRIALGRAPQLATFAALVGIGLILVLDAANPAAVIARTNMTRDSDEPVDVDYLVALGPDAFPTLVERRDDLSDFEQEMLDDALDQYDTVSSDDWRGANRSRTKADESLCTIQGQSC